MNVAVIGAGYVGIVQAAGLAHLGHHVALSDADAARIERLRAGEVPLFEPGLAELVERGVARGLLEFRTDNVAAADDARVVFLTLPTPPDGNGAADTATVLAVAAELAPHLPGDAVLATKSTVPVGTAALIRDVLREAGSEAGVVSNPEFLSEGNAVEDFLRAERIVIGTFEPDHGRVVADLYRGLSAQVLIMDPASAELVKYGANGYLATRLTFANALADIADEVGADVDRVLAAIGLDRRIGPHYLRPGPGYGGSCLPKDTTGFIAMAADSGYDFRLLRAVVETNRDHLDRIVRRCLDLLGDARRVALWGLAFKAGTDDTRESPGVAIGRRLAEAGADVVAYDPEAAVPDLPSAPDPVAAAAGAGLLVVATEWPELLRVDLAEVSKVMAGDVVYDVRNHLDPGKVRAAGLRYVGLGRAV